jgi:hypothetical protein
MGRAKHFTGILLIMLVQCGLLMNLCFATLSVNRFRPDHTTLSQQATRSILTEIDEEDAAEKISLQHAHLLHPALLQKQRPFLQTGVARHKPLQVMLSGHEPLYLYSGQFRL